MSTSPLPVANGSHTYNYDQWTKCNGTNIICNFMEGMQRHCSGNAAQPFDPPRVLLLDGWKLMPGYRNVALSDSQRNPTRPLLGYASAKLPHGLARVTRGFENLEFACHRRRMAATRRFTAKSLHSGCFKPLALNSAAE